jgi:hypothetical protein
LIFILVFGLSIGNLDELKINGQKFSFRPIKQGVAKFKELIIEATFFSSRLILLLFLAT